MLTSRVRSMYSGLVLLTALFAATLLADAPRASAQSVIYVNAAATGANNGTSWADAYQTVQPALTAAPAGTQIWVAAGRYVERITLKEGVALYGGFVGTEDPNTFDLATRNFAAHETILDGNQSGSVVTAPSSATAACRIDGFTITNGKATNGGGVYLSTSSPTIANNRIFANTANSNGGGLYVSSSSPTLVANSISSNRAVYGIGGGLYESASSATITGNSITDNTASVGGGLHLTSSASSVTNNTVADNIATSSGGGLFLTACTTTKIANNVIATNCASLGGGVYLSSSTALIANNTILHNLATFRGGGLCALLSSPTIANNIVAFNSSGIYGQQALPTLRNNCVYGNATYNYYGLTDPTGSNGNISADPALVGSDFGGWHLDPNSPCIGTGSNADAMGTTDLDSQPRVQPTGGIVDIGADEFDGSAPVWSYAIVRVSPAGDDARDGSSWPLAKRTVQAAIDQAAATGGEVWVQTGTYTERITLARFVHLYGGFTATESARDQRDWRTNLTTLDGQQQGSVITANHRGSAVSSVDGFTVTGGSAAVGGGLYLINYASPTIINCCISGNSATTGGAFYLSNNCAPAILQNTITDNSATSGGAGLYLYASAPIIRNNTISRNEAACIGGGLALRASSTPAITNNFITDNRAGTGAGLYVESSNPSIATNLIARNYAGAGGGLYLYACSPTILCNTITGNGASCAGALYLYDRASPYMASNIVAFNSSGLCGPDATPSLRNNCVFGNAAYNFSGIADPTGTSGNISTDPLLAGPAYGGWHLLPNSPCINAGSGAGSTLDLDGQPRIQPSGGVVDIGADESDGSTPPTGPFIIVRVSPQGDDNQDGSSWSQAKRSVQAAITAAAALGGDVWVQTGTYYECVTLPRFVHVFGGFAGTETARDQRDWQAHPTTLDAQQQGSVVAATHRGHALSALDGFTVTHGSAADGGGIYLAYCSPTLANNMITANRALTGNGGGLCLTVASPAITNTAFVGNTASAGHGGGLYLLAASPTCTDILVRENSAPAGNGGGLCLIDSVPTIQHASITANAAGAGGGLSLSAGSAATITSSTIANNTASTGGGGLHIDDSSPTIADNMIFSNTAASQGGGLYITDCSLANITNSVIAGNSAGSAGGALYVTVCSGPNLINDTIAGNRAATGGALYWRGCSPATISNTVFAFNSTGLYGAGTAPPTFRANCVFGNTAYNFSGLTDPTGTSGNISADPLFIQNPDPNTPGSIGDLHLQPASPCINTGNNADVWGTTDLNGFTRIVGGIVDMGAYEYHLLGDLNGDGFVDAADLALFTNCLTGPNLAYPQGCGPSDLDTDTDVDLADFARLQALAN